MRPCRFRQHPALDRGAAVADHPAMPDAAPIANRRLAAILVADVAGYSRMVQADEAGTLAALRDRRTGIVEPVLAAHAGRMVKQMGDGYLAEFASAVNAVAAALDLQARMAAANAGLPPDRHLTLRIGINLGDILGEGDDIFGDGVNIAARLEPLAEPGGIVVSAKVQAEAQGKTAATFTDMGEQALKNMAAPVRAYRVGWAAAAAAAAPHGDARLSVAVLPFTSLGTDADQQYFGDGLTEDIITELARIPILRVASRNGSFRFRGPDADLAAAARALGVRFIVEGSVRRLGPRIRITAQLIDTATGAHLWADRYDRPADGIFDVQDDVVRTIAGTVNGRLQAMWIDQAGRKPLGERTAFDLAMEAEQMPWYSPELRRKAGAMAQEAIRRDPRHARAHAILALLMCRDWEENLSSPPDVLRDALEHARAAITLEPRDFYPEIAAANICLYLREYELADLHLERARHLNPHRPGVLATQAHILLFSGKASESQQLLDASLKIDTSNHPSWVWSSYMAIAFVSRDYAAALRARRRIENAYIAVHAYAAAAHALSDDPDAARQEVQQALARDPACSVSAIMSREPYRLATDRDHLIEGMRRAGVPP